ncbi:MAG: 4'-phosphopantetheinyl transferase family protein [Bacteroidia bacterium]
MPAILKKNTPNGLSIGVWEITETQNELLDKAALSDEENTMLASFRNEGRRLQWLAVRALLAEFIVPRPAIAYKANGKPFLPGRKELISISHSGKLAAIALHTSLAPGIDVEEINPKINKISSRFVSDSEKAYLKQETLTEQLCIIWAAKEVLYKTHNEGILSFKENLSVSAITPADKGELQGTINKDGIITNHKLTFQRINNYILVYTA